MEIIEIKWNIATFNFGGVEVNVHGKKVRTFATWLHYLPDERLVPLDKNEEEILAWDDAGTRDDEARRIMNLLAPYLAQKDSIPIIIGGDFNVHSHLYWQENTKNLWKHQETVVRWDCRYSCPKLVSLIHFVKNTLIL